MKSEVISFNEMDQVSYFEQTLQSERKISLTSEENQSFMLQMEEAKKSKPNLFRKTFIYYHQIKMMRLAQNLALGKLY